MIRNSPNDTAGNGDFVCDGCSFGKIITEDFATFSFRYAKGTTIFNRGLGFGIKRFLLGHATTKMQLNHTKCFCRKLTLGSRCRERLITILCAPRFQPQHITKRKTKCSKHPCLYHAASRNHTAKPFTTLAIRYTLGFGYLKHAKDPLKVHLPISRIIHCIQRAKIAPS